MKTVLGVRVRKLEMYISTHRKINWYMHSSEYYSLILFKKITET